MQIATENDVTSLKVSFMCSVCISLIACYPERIQKGGKALGSVRLSVCLSVSTNISRSGDLGIWATGRHNKS